jgi:hypothetical protein
MNEAAKFPQHAHRKDITFRQAEEIDPLPKMLAYGELGDELRLEIWDVFYSFFNSKVYFAGGIYAVSTFRNEALVPATWYCRDVLRMPLDDAEEFCK